MIAVGGLVVRVAYTLLVRPHVNPISDATTYHLLANQLARGHGYVRPYDLLQSHRSLPSAEFPPLFPALLALTSLIGNTTVTGQRLVACVIGTGTVVAVGLLGRRIAGDAVGLLAAVLAAVHPLLFLSDGSLMAETISTLLVTASLLMTYRLLAAPSARGAVALGAVLGLAALARAENLALALLLVLPLARRRAVLVPIALLATAVVLLPWTVRNALTFHRLIAVSNNSGTLVSGANCPPVYRGPQEGLWRYSCAAAVDIRGLDEAASADRQRRAGLHYARVHLGDQPRLVTVRVLRTWGLWQPAQQVAYESFEGRPQRWEALGQHLDWMLVVLALAGAFVVRRRADVVLWPFGTVVVLATATAAATYGNERFREATEPVIVVLAAVAVLELVRSVAARRRGDARPPRASGAARPALAAATAAR